MKKSRIAKLALMGASITALAATLTTSTYAWYVSNRTATVTGGEGSTGAVGSDGSVLVSWDGTKWFKSIDFSTATSGAVTAGEGLQPVHSDGAGAFVYDDDTTTNIANDYFKFKFKIKAGVAGTVTPTITLKTTTVKTDLTGQLAYVETGSISAGTMFVVNALDAMYVQQKVGTSYSYYEGKNGTAAFTSDSCGNAHTYYHAVTGKDPKYTEVEGALSSTAFAKFDLDEDTAIELEYIVFLEGADPQCFNSCVGQDFSIDLSFQFEPAE